MSRKKVILNTNPPWLLTGLAENGTLLARHLEKTGKYDLVYYASQTHVQDPNHARQPWKSRGCIPPDPQVHARAQQDPAGYGRWLAYGNLMIGDLVKDEKPDIFWGSDDIWTFGNEFWKSSWWKQIHSCLHVTVDSLPVSEMAYDQAKETAHYYVWAKFAMDEMRKRKETAHVKQIYGAIDVAEFAPVSTAERADLRRRFGISADTTVIGYTFRNQLRKEALNLLWAFRDFKRENPRANVKVHLHTSWSETAQGWDIPRIIKSLDIDPRDVLCTYVCKQCGGWHVAPYSGEDIDCPHCGAKKSMVTANIAHGVLHEEMKLLYAIRDATVSPSTSGGLEYENVNTLLCGLPLACTNYSSGADFCLQPFVTPIEWHPRFEAGSSFIKASNDVGSIKRFIAKVHSLPAAQRQAIGEQGREWAVKTFSIDTVGKQWEDVFDALPPKDWSSITLTAKPQNPDFPMPQLAGNEEWIKSLYNNILMCEPDPDGMKNWLQSLANGTPRQAIYQFFCDRARDGNAKNQPAQDFSVLFDKGDRKKILFVIKESGGDVFICTSLFKGLRDLYPEADLYVATEPKFHEMLAANPLVHKVLAYHSAMEQELLMRSYVDHYYFPALATQRQLNYLTHDRVGLDLNPRSALPFGWIPARGGIEGQSVFVPLGFNPLPYCFT